MDFTQLTKYMDSLDGVGVPGCDLAVWRDHEPIYRHMAGFRDAEGTQPVRGDEVYCLYSCTKVFTTCAAMQLIQRGLLDLDDPVSAYLPAYAHLTVRDGDALRPAKRAMTVRHLMSMQCGLDYDMATPAPLAELARTKGQATTRQLVDARAKDPLCFDPGTDFLYSLGHDVLAAVIEVASGLRFSEYLRQNIFEPLGLGTMTFTPDEAALKRLCAQYVFDGKKGVPCAKTDNSYRFSPNYESGGAGLYGDVADYIVFADALACGGVAKNGAKILSPKLIQLWSANQLGPRSRASYETWKRHDFYSYALGVRTRVDTSAGGRGQIGEFGWDGAAGAWVMIDPINHISAFFAMHMRDFPYVYDVIHQKLRDLIYAGLE
ncbi:MAG: beta-lactamase family protein [Clostridia bacterium]|nr:beta-lactamase family protein [Clostridia bacterium]